MSTAEITAKKLKIIMKERNLRQVDILRLCEPFCKKYGVQINKNDLSQYVSGKVMPANKKLLALSAALNVPPSYFILDDDNITPEDAEYIKSLGYIHPLEELPEDIAALNNLLREIGWEIIRTNGSYYLGEIGLLSDADIARLKTAAVSALKVTYDMMVKERQKGIIS